jgi:hypothetical protein
MTARKGLERSTWAKIRTKQWGAATLSCPSVRVQIYHAARFAMLILPLSRKDDTVQAKQ